MFDFKDLITAGTQGKKTESRELMIEYGRQLISSNKTEKLTFEYMMACLEVYMALDQNEDALAIIEQIENFWSQTLNDEKFISKEDKLNKFDLIKIKCLIELKYNSQAIQEIVELMTLKLLNKEDLCNLANAFVLKEEYEESLSCFDFCFNLDPIYIQAVFGYISLLYKLGRQNLVASFVIDRCILIYDFVERVNFVCAVCIYMQNEDRDDEVVEIYDLFNTNIDSPETIESLNQNQYLHLGLLKIGLESNYFVENYNKVIEIGKIINLKFVNQDPDYIEPKFYCMLAESYYLSGSSSVDLHNICIRYLNKALKGYKLILSTINSVDMEILTKIEKIQSVMLMLKKQQTIDWYAAELWL